jgi:hypothetical protein
MAVNPYASPLYARLTDTAQKRRNRAVVKRNIVLLNIVRNFANWYDFKDLSDTHGIIKVNDEFFIGAKKAKMRMISRLDWVYYNPKDLARAIETDTVEQYYAQQLGDPNSDPNIWNDAVKEYELKTYYANRVGRPLDSLDNL